MCAAPRIPSHSPEPSLIKLKNCNIIYIANVPLSYAGALIIIACGCIKWMAADEGGRIKGTHSDAYLQT